jgi:hypothetical protein
MPLFCFTLEGMRLFAKQCFETMMSLRGLKIYDLQQTRLVILIL